MIRDQADELRQLVRLAQRGHAQRGGAPALLLVVGASSGVGATAIAANLALALATQGRRTVLIDADLTSGARLRAGGQIDRGTIVDVFSGRRTIHEVLQRAPCGVQFVPGLLDEDRPTEPTAAACARLCAELQGLSRHADVVVAIVDEGGGPLNESLWRLATGVVVVATEDAQSRVAAYALLKQRHPEPAHGRLYALINRASDPALAAEAQERIVEAVRRFLGRTIAPAGSIASDAGLEAVDPLARPLVVHSPRCEASRAIERLAELAWRDLSALRLPTSTAGPSAA